jgi:hypothetical protein
MEEAHDDRFVVYVRSRRDTHARRTAGTRANVSFATSVNPAAATDRDRPIEHG